MAHIPGKDGVHPGRWQARPSCLSVLCFIISLLLFFLSSPFSFAPMIAVDGRFAAVKNKLKLCPALAVKDKCHIFAVYY